MKFKYIYILLAILGLVLTWYYNIQFYLSVQDTSIWNFIDQTNTTFPAKSISADISVVAITFLIWMTYESLKLKIKYWWVVIPLTFLIAIAFSFPLFLYMRANRLEVINQQKQ
ncbi:DUF2834 domain-containing protein [Winogradskyella aurantia]|uniref:DUF2834 domain-containing protein n=1 Tax=Winogradskyella aurantia TaxID=1915063 RepID=A0A265UM73_9FLAO|nr:DUF2834 domain-containing protein [Winogradskyella aurantia]OZV66410.1 hypothetical protein CA834_14250 [Winogradskyella aurantia]